MAKAKSITDPHRKLKMFGCLALLLIAVFEPALILLTAIAAGSFGALRYALAS